MPRPKKAGVARSPQWNVEANQMEENPCGMSERDARDQAIALRKHHRHAKISTATENAHNEKRKIASPDNGDGRRNCCRDDEADDPEDGENEGRASPLSSRKLQAVERIAEESQGIESHYRDNRCGEPGLKRKGRHAREVKRVALEKNEVEERERNHRDKGIFRDGVHKMPFLLQIEQLSSERHYTG